MGKKLRWRILVILLVLAGAAAGYVVTEDHNGDGRPDVWRVYDRQRPKPTAVGEPVGDEIRVPALVRTLRSEHFTNPPDPASRLFPSENGIATPTISRKKGKTRSVGVHPCHFACWSGG